MEQWKPIPGYEEWYEVSNEGRIRTVPRILKPWHHNENGAEYACIAADGPIYGWQDPNGGQKVMVHRLVALAFIGPCPEGKEVNHKDGVRHHNSAENLEYVTRSENVLHSYRHLNRRSIKGRKGLSHKLNAEQILALKKRHAAGVPSRLIAAEFGITPSGVTWHTRKVSY